MSSLTALTLSQTITFLTTPLLLSAAYSQQQLQTLKQILGISLSSSAISNSKKSITLTLSPETLPPRPIYAACIASGIRWIDWIALLGGREFDLIVDTTRGCLSIRLPGSTGQLIWSTASERRGAMEKLRRGHSKRLSLSLAEDEIKIIISAPTPTSEEMGRPVSPESTVSDESEAESDFSLYTASDSSASSLDSRSSSPVQCERSAVYVPPKRTPSSPIHTAKSGKVTPQVHRKAQDTPQLFIDESKSSVTPYDGGKVGVLTGGVMLGGRGASLPDTKGKGKSPTATPRSWRKM